MGTRHHRSVEGIADNADRAQCQQHDSGDHRLTLCLFGQIGVPPDHRSPRPPPETAPAMNVRFKTTSCKASRSQPVFFIELNCPIYIMIPQHPAELDDHDLSSSSIM